MNLHFLHGFLGFASDWDTFRESFYPHECFTYKIENFITNFSKANESQFKSWAHNFNEHVFSKQNTLGSVDMAGGADCSCASVRSKTRGAPRARRARKATSNAAYAQNDNCNLHRQPCQQSLALNPCANKKNVLVGYSLGGRLALHCLIEKNQWDGAILISTNPGLKSLLEKKMRIQHDAQWGHRFMTEPWNDVLNAWNAQSVFSDHSDQNSDQKTTFNREEHAYHKNNIYNMITIFSLGRQKNLRSSIKKIQKPILWISGGLDKKFVDIGKEVALLNSNIKSIIIPNAGHRAPWESSHQFKKICNDFLQDLYMY